MSSTTVTTATNAKTPKAPTRPVRRRPEPELRFFRAHVTAAGRLTPRLVRITLGGPDLAGFVGDGPDQRVKVFLPRPGQSEPVLPAERGDGWYAAYRAMPDDVRPTMRTYTIRRHRPDTNEVDIEFVLHGDEGPASRWAGQARVGDPLTFYGPYADYEPTPGTDWQLLLGDETAVPAIGAIVESLPAGARARVFLEVADADDELTFATAGQVELTWLHRAGRPGARNDFLVDAVRAASLPDGRPYVWIGAEASKVKALRRHLWRERGYDRTDIYFCGYWRGGRTEDDPEPEQTDDA